MNFSNRGNNNNNNNPNSKSENQVKNVLEKINNCLQQRELAGLIYLLQSFQQSISQSLNKFSFELPARDHNINSAIVEKCLMIKQKNQEIRLKAFNLRGTLIRLMPNNRKPWPHEREYQDILQQIRARGISLRQKIQKCRRMPVQRANIVHTQELVGEPMRELKKATEWLEKQTIVLRKEFNLLIKTIPEDKSNDL